MQKHKTGDSALWLKAAALAAALAAGLALWLQIAAPAAAEIFEARAVYISDGDSLTARVEGRGSFKLRLYGVDAPELDQPYGPEAKRFLSRLVFKKNIRAETVETDAYGRRVAIVIVDGRNVNLALTEAGLAWFYGRYCRRADWCAALKRAEGLARLARRGLWRDDNPCPPERWRRGSLICARRPGQ